MLQTDKLNNIGPQTYLTDTLPKIASNHPINRVSELIPWTHQKVEISA
ncbi:transposase domain-containing protein [Acidiphilium sp. AL]|nr:transposase domain-containing protein [Acidiphilium sp. AL]